VDDGGARFRPIRRNRTGQLAKALTPDMVWCGGIRRLSASRSALHALRSMAALDHQADIAKVQEWLGHANSATTRI
jgi:hypothetical protein